MAQVRMTCPKCGEMLEIDEQYVGHKGQCPYCDERFVVSPSDDAVVLKPVIPVLKPVVPPPKEEKEEIRQEEEKKSKDTCESMYSVYVLKTPGDFRNFAWRRCAARYIDWGVGGCFLALLFPSLKEIMDWMDLSRVWIVVLVAAILFFSDTLVYALFKNTLGKKLCGIGVCDHEGRRINGTGYFTRSLRVFFEGWGGYIPLWDIVTMAWQYKCVCKDRPTMYDEKKVYQARPLRGRRMYDILLVLVALVIMIVKELAFIGAVSG